MFAPMAAQFPDTEFFLLHYSGTWVLQWTN